MKELNLLNGFADSNRWAPGCGHLDFAKIVQTLKKINYQGYVSAEILPLPDPDSCARLTAETLSKLNIN
jgi:sugar phosphate isomerase/epimerase